MSGVSSLLQFDGQLAGFIAASLIIIVVPGVDFALITRQVTRYGRATGFVTLGGLVVGALIHATLATAGLSALLLSSSKLYTILRFAGVVYLVYLGLTILWATRPKPAVAQEPAGEQVSVAAGHGGGAAVGSTADTVARTGPGGDEPPAKVTGKAFRMGILSNILNVKVVVFYVTFLPQFVAPGPSAAGRTAVHALLFITLAVIWWICYILLINSLQQWLARPRVRLVIERVTGLTLIAVALKIALD